MITTFPMQSLTETVTSADSEDSLLTFIKQAIESVSLMEVLTYVNHFLQHSLTETISLDAELGNIINHFTRIAIADSVLFTDLLTIKFVTKVFADNVRLQEWLRIRRIRIQRWSN